MEYEVFEYEKRLVGSGKRVDRNHIMITIHEKNYFVKSIEDENKWELSEPKKEKKKKKGRKKKGFENNITKKLKESYPMAFDKKSIHDISVMLNENYKTSLGRDELKRIIGNILKNNKISVTRTRVNGYVKYFELNGQIQKQINHHDFFTIVKNNLIPTKKEERNLGLLDELGMS